jgi:hypothetical protein
MEGNFTKIIYSEPYITMNGIYIHFPIKISKINKNIAYFEVQSNMEIISKLLENPDNEYVQIDAFNDSTDLDKEAENYGDPAYSLKSYLTFFEDPIVRKKEKSPKSSSSRSSSSESSPLPTVLNDWLEYSMIDAFSNKMKIRDNIILIEYRGFPRILDNYIHSVLPKKTNKVIGNLKLGLLKEFIEKEKRK